MKLSIRSRILLAYGALVVLVFVVLLTGFWRLRSIGARLTMIQAGYLPIVKTVNSLFSFSHLDENFNVDKIVANRSNKLFLDTISIHNPTLLENSLQNNIESARKTLQQTPSPSEERRLARMDEIVQVIIQDHRDYIDMIKNTLKLIQANQIDEALAQNAELIEQKRRVRTRIDFLSRRVDEQIRNGIFVSVREERNSVVLTLVLSVVTLIIALFIGLVAILSLRPLEQLKKAAREIAQGDLRQRVEIRSNDEVGEVGREFNRMADAVEERDQALRKQQEQLLQSEKMAVIGRMASKISHEIRNPLNALSLNVEMLSDEVKGSESEKTLHALSTEIDRLNRVAESYLSLARTPKQGTEETDLRKVLDHLSALIRAECEQNRVELTTEIPQNLPNIRANSARLEQALLNLLRNALEASHPGSAIGLDVQTENGAVRLRIWDRGKGISSDLKDKIFEPFFSTKEKGTGLGLAITNEIIREQGGTIECQSSEKGGTTFAVTLPIANA